MSIINLLLIFVNYLQTPLLELKLPLRLKWTRGKALPFVTFGYPRAVVFKKKVYIGGGGALSDRESRTVIVYDSEQNSYDTLPPYAFKWFSMVVINNQLVLVGGADEQTKKVTNNLGVWNEQSKRWTQTYSLPPMITACHSPSVANHNDRWLVVIGGAQYGYTHLSKVEILDTTESSQWHHAASLPQPLRCALPATIGNMCYLLGGYTEGDTSSQKVFSVCLDDLISEAISQPASASAPPTPSPYAWQSLPDTPYVQSTGLVFNGGLLAVGGGSIVTWTSLIYHYQPSSRKWVKAGELPSGQYGCTCTVLPSGDLHIAGGAGRRVDIASVQ